MVYVLLLLFTVAAWNLDEMYRYMPRSMGTLVLLYFAIVFIIDFEYKLILHNVSIIGGIICGVIGIYLHGFLTTLYGGIAGFGIVYSFYLLGWLFTVVVAKLQKKSIGDIAFGFGDVTLSTTLGLLMGWPSIMTSLFLAIMLGGIVSAILMVTMIIRRRYRRFVAIPFGPFFILGAMLIIFFPSFTFNLVASGF